MSERPVMSAPLDYAPAPLRRQIGLFGAVMLGLGSILGTGVFVGLAQATALAGPWVLVAIVLAGALAFCNAMSSAQLAAAHPVAGGTYEYGYRLLSPAWGFTAGWTFLLAKSASAATAALAVSAVVLRHLWVHLPIRPREDVLLISAALLVLSALAIGCLLGLRKTASLNAVLVSITLFGLFSFIIVMSGRAAHVWVNDPFETRGIYLHSMMSRHGLSDLAAATGLCFVAFTGYGRLATLGEEVSQPQRTIPRAIACTIAASLLIYLGLGFVIAARWLIPVGLTEPNQTLMTVARSFSRDDVAPFLVELAAPTAMLGVLLNLILGLSRVWLAMGRRGDMPRVLARVSEEHGTPVPATILAGLVIAGFVLVGDVRLTWSFSAFSVLIYYAITNWACLRLPVEHRRYPRSLAWAGLVSCLSLAWFVEVKVWAVGVGLIAIGLVWHLLRTNFRSAVLVPSPGNPGEG